MILCRICHRDYDYSGHDEDCPMTGNYSLVPYTMEGQNLTKLLAEYELKKYDKKRF